MTAVHQFLVCACIRKGSLLTRISKERDTERKKERERELLWKGSSSTVFGYWS